MTSISITSNISHFGLIVAFAVFLLSYILFKLIHRISPGSQDERLITDKGKDAFLMECMIAIMTIFGSLLYYGSARCSKIQNLSIISLTGSAAGIFFRYLLLYEQIVSYDLGGAFLCTDL